MFEGMQWHTRHLIFFRCSLCSKDRVQEHETGPKTAHSCSADKHRNVFCRGKKSQSVDVSSAVPSGVAKIGVALVPPAVPSANVPLEVKVSAALGVFFFSTLHTHGGSIQMFEPQTI